VHLVEGRIRGSTGYLWRTVRFQAWWTPPRATDESRLQHRGSVGGEHEEDVRALPQAIELVQQPIEHDLFACVVHCAAFARNEIGVLDYDERRLKDSGERHVLRQKSDLLGRDQKSCVIRQVLALDRGEIVNLDPPGMP
jgi:hypothetical protein